VKFSLKRHKEPIGKFLVGWYLNGMAIWIVAYAGGASRGPAFIIVSTLAIASLKTWLQPVLIEFFGLDYSKGPVKNSGKTPSRVVPIGVALGQLGLYLLTYLGIYGFLILLLNLTGFGWSVEPISLGLLLEVLFRLVFWGGRRVRRSFGRIKPSIRNKEGG
jgi:hypothetical protein